MGATKHTQRRPVEPNSAARRASVKKTNKPPSYHESIRKKRIYREGLVERVRMAREASGFPTQAVAAAMSISHRRYLSYERNAAVVLDALLQHHGSRHQFLLCEHRPALRLEDDMRFVAIARAEDGEDSEKYALAVRVLAETQRTLEQERRRHH